MIYPQVYIQIMWTDDTQRELACFEGRTGSWFEDVDQAKARARMIFDRTGAAPWRDAHVTDVQVDVLVKEHQYASPELALSLRDRIPEDDLVASRQDHVQALNRLADKWGVPG